MALRCPRCSSMIEATEPDPAGFFACPGCGARLRPPTKPAQPANDIQALVGEMRDMRRLVGEVLQLQAQILTALQTRPTTSWSDEAEGADESEPSSRSTGSDGPPGAVPRVRHRRKSVVIVDDDPETLKAALAALEQAQVPVRMARDGSAGIALMAEEKPDVLVLELDLGEPMPGKDLINMVKATMEWVDVPIVLYTRAEVKSQQEARTIHGADEVVLKGPGASEALLNRVIRIFQGR